MVLSAAGETDRAKVEEFRGRLRRLYPIRWGNGRGLVFSITQRRVASGNNRVGKTLP